MTPEQEANAIGKIAAVFDEILTAEPPGPETWIKVLEIFAKALVSVADNPQMALDALIAIVQDPNNDDVADRLGLKRKDAP